MQVSEPVLLMLMIVSSLYIRESDSLSFWKSWQSVLLKVLTVCRYERRSIWQSVLVLPVPGAVSEGNAARTDSKLGLIYNSLWFRVPYPFQVHVPLDHKSPTPPGHHSPASLGHHPPRPGKKHFFLWNLNFGNTDLAKKKKRKWQQIWNRDKTA